MSVPSCLLERNRIVGKEDENFILVLPVLDPEKWLEPHKRNLPRELEQAPYHPRIEELPANIGAEFEDEIPSQHGFTSFGRVYREPQGSQLEVATGEATSVVELIRRGHLGDAYAHKIGVFLNKLAVNKDTAKAFTTPTFFKPLFPVKRVVKRTLGANGTSTGMHESYLADRKIDLKPIESDRAYGPVLMTHLVTRLWSFAGGVRKKGNIGYEYVAGAKLSTIETDYQEETTHTKPLINTRDRPYADANIYRRNHITCGDGNMWPWPEFMKFTTTSLVHRLVENGIDCSDVLLDDPIAAAKTCAMFDLGEPDQLNARVQNLSVMVNGEPMHPLRLQLKLVEKCEAMAQSCYISAEEAYALVEWREICELMMKDALACRKKIEFIGKLVLGSKALDRRLKEERKITMDWNSFENAWCNLDPENSLGIKSREQLAAQQEIMQLDLMPYERTRHDGRAEAIAWGQANMADWPLDIRFYWNRLTTFDTLSRPNPYDDNAKPWIDFLKLTRSKRLTG